MNSTTLFLIAIFAVAVIVVPLLSKIGKTKTKKTKHTTKNTAQEIEDNDLTFLQHVTFNKKNLLTETEKTFLYALSQAVQGYYIFPQVATHAILKCSTQNYSNYLKAFNRFNRTIIDFVICDQNFTIIAIVELNDRTHKNKTDEDKLRDDMLKKAGYKTVRFNCENYSVDSIRAKLFS